MRYCCERAQKGDIDAVAPLWGELEIKRNTYLAVRTKPNASLAKWVGESALPGPRSPTTVPHTSAYFASSIQNCLSGATKSVQQGLESIADEARMTAARSKRGRTFFGDSKHTMA